MEELKKLKLRLDFKQYPASWRVHNVGVDWAGEPLVLFEEGKPPQPPREAGMDALIKWLNTPAEAHHLIYWTGAASVHVRFSNSSRSLFANYVQPFGEGWLLGDARGGAARIFTKDGSKLRNTLDLSDASKDIQTTSAGHIWVSYFDEGVFGGDIGENGLVCFDANGSPIFRYAEFAESHNLPLIDDCYALNVSEDTIWLCYYTDFPLVCLKDFQLEHVWDKWEPTRAFAVRGQRIVLFPAYWKPYLVSRSLDSASGDIWKLADSEGRNLSKLIGPSPDQGRVSFSVAARGSRVYVWTEDALFELP